MTITIGINHTCCLFIPVLGTDHLTCRGGGGYGVFFIQNFFFGHHELEYLFFLLPKPRNYFQEFNIRLYDKNSESDYNFCSPPKSEYFFSNIGNQNIFFRKKSPPPPPPWKLNGPSLRVMVFTAAFNNISVRWWRLVLLLEEAENTTALPQVYTINLLCNKLCTIPNFKV